MAVKIKNIQTLEDFESELDELFFKGLFKQQENIKEDEKKKEVDQRKKNSN